MFQKIWISFLFFNFFQSNSFAEIKLNSPRETFQTYLKSMVAYKSGNEEAIKEAIKTFDLSKTTIVTKETIGKQSAILLIKILDRIEKIDYQKIPQDPKEQKWIYKKINIVKNGQFVEPEISLIKINNQWLFSNETIESLDDFWETLKEGDTVSGIVELSNFATKIQSMLPGWSLKKFLFLTGFQWLGIFFIFFISFLLTFIFKKVILYKLAQFFSKKNIFLSESKKIEPGFSFTLIIFSILWIFIIQFLSFNTGMLRFSLRAGYIFLSIGTTFLSFKIIDVFTVYFLSLAAKTSHKFDDILVPLLSKSSKVLVFCIGLLFVCHNLTINVTNVIAGLGIGGLAIALAAKDTLSNLFGSLTVVLDKPFEIGDAICIGKDTEGEVEEVGFRSTRIRTWYNSVITVPNSQLTNMQIDNFGKRKYRRFVTDLGVEYDTTPEKIEAFCEGIRQIILSHKLTRKDYFHVYFNNYGNSALLIQVYLFWEVPDRSTELLERHRFLIDVLRLSKEMDVAFAFPTQTLHLINNECEGKKERPLDPKIGRKIGENSISYQSPRSGVKDGQVDFDS